MGNKDTIAAMYKRSNYAELICMGLFVINVICSILSAVITECERAYPIFHAVLKQNISPRKALLPMVMM